MTSITPSLHSSRVNYEWALQPPWGNPILFPDMPKELYTLCEKVGEKKSKATRNMFGLSAADFPTRYSETQTYTPFEQWLPDDIPEGKEQWSKTGVWFKGRDKGLYLFACVLRGQGVPYDIALAECIKADLAVCDPPLGEATVGHKVDSAWTRDENQYRANYSEKEESELKALLAALDIPEEERVFSLGDVMRAVKNDEIPKQEFLPVCIDSNNPADGVELECYVKGRLHLLYGAPTAGKTEFHLQSVLKWKDRKNVWYTEEPKELWAQKIGNLFPDLSEIQSEDFEHIEFVYAEGWTRGHLLFDMIRRTSDTDTFTIDPGKLLGIEDENAPADIRKVMSPLRMFCMKYNKTVFFVHYARKSGGVYGQDISGGHDFLGTVDVAAQITRVAKDDINDPRRRLSIVKGRGFREGKYFYRMRLPTWWLEQTDAPDLIESKDIKDATWELLEETAPETWTIRAILKNLGIDESKRKTLERHLKSWAKDGEIERVPDITKSNVSGQKVEWRGLTKDEGIRR